MEEGQLFIPCSIRKSIKDIVSWLDLNRKVLSDEGYDIKVLKASLAPYSNLRSLEKSQNPWVIVQLRWDGAYADVHEDYLCKLSDWLFVGACVEDFCLGDRAGKHSEVTCYIKEHYTPRWATDEEIDTIGRDRDYFSLFHGEECLRYRENAKLALKKAFKEWAPIYDPEKDTVPPYNAFKDVFDETMKTVPTRGVLTVKKYLDYGKPRLEDAPIEFDDMRQAALMVESKACIEYYLKSYDESDILKYIDFGKVNTDIQVDFEDNSWGCSIDYVPEERQWIQMQEECPPRCTWEEMLRYARGVVKQKRLKRDLSGVGLDK